MLFNSRQKHLLACMLPAAYKQCTPHMLCDDFRMLLLFNTASEGCSAAALWLDEMDIVTHCPCNCCCCCPLLLLGTATAAAGLADRPVQGCWSR